MDKPNIDDDDIHMGVTYYYQVASEHGGAWEYSAVVPDDKDYPIGKYAYKAGITYLVFDLLGAEGNPGVQANTLKDIYEFDVLFNGHEMTIELFCIEKATGNKVSMGVEPVTAVGDLPDGAELINAELTQLGVWKTTLFVGKDKDNAKEITLDASGSAVGDFITKTYFSEIYGDHPLKTEDTTIRGAINEVLDTSQGGVYIVDATPAEEETNVKCEMKPNGLEVGKIVADTRKINAVVEWDRTNKDYVGSVTVNDVEVTKEESNYGVTTGTVTLELAEGATEITVVLDNTIKKVIPFVFESKPVIQSIEIDGYPATQTAYKEGDIVKATITVDKDVTKVEVADFELGTSQVFDVAENNVVEVYFTVANRNISGTPQEQKLKARVFTSTGSFSDYSISEAGKLLDNTKPELRAVSIVYPTGQKALKGSESAEVSFTQYCVNESSVTSDYLSISNITNTGATVTRTSGDYLYDTDTLKYTLKYAPTDRTEVQWIKVNIVNVAPEYVNAKTMVVASGGSAVTETQSFNQVVKIKSITPPGANKGTVTSPLVTTSYADTYDLSITAYDSDDHSDTELELNAVIMGASGLESSIVFKYVIRGFAEKTITVVYPALSVVLPCTVVNADKLVVANGLINSNPPFNIMTRKVDASVVTNETADAYAYKPDTNEIMLPQSLFTFGYSADAPVTFKIRESAV